LETRSAHQFFTLTKVYRACQQLAADWDERALALTGYLSDSLVADRLEVTSDDEADDKIALMEFSHLSPPFEISFIDSMMETLFQEIQSDIIPDSDEEDNEEDEN